MHEYEGYHTCLDGDDLLAGWLTWEHPKHMGKLVFVEEETEKPYPPHPDYSLHISDTDRLRGAAVADLAKQAGWKARSESPWDYTGPGPDHRKCPHCGATYDYKKSDVMCPSCGGRICLQCGRAQGANAGDICPSCEEDVNAFLAWDEVYFGRGVNGAAGGAGDEHPYTDGEDDGSVRK